jgi:ribosomal protein L25 (general stress protein Ctc)
VQKGVSAIKFQPFDRFSQLTLRFTQEPRPLSEPKVPIDQNRFERTSKRLKVQNGVPAIVFNQSTDNCNRYRVLLGNMTAFRTPKCRSTKISTSSYEVEKTNSTKLLSSKPFDFCCSISIFHEYNSGENSTVFFH